VIDLRVGGVGIWTPGFADAAAWASGSPDPAVVSPRAELLPVALRRRATTLASMVASAASQAAGQAGADLARLPFVFGSALGEIGPAVAMLDEQRTGEGLPSPTRFHNAVHNGPAAYVSIATGNRGFSTAVAAGWETPAAALVEAAALLAERGGEVMVVLADEPPPAPFGAGHRYRPLAVALHLAAGSDGPVLAFLRGLRRAPGGAPSVPPAHAGHPCAGALALATAVWSRAAGQVALGPEGARGWVVDVVPGRPA
jgi:hypothetical protein